MEDLGVDPKVGWIYLLPTNAKSVIVKYSPKWKISCVLPEQERDITLTYYNPKIDDILKTSYSITSPDIILSHSLTKPWTDETKVVPYFSLFAIDSSKKDGIYALPYRISNVYSSGNICFGHTSSTELSNLRSANNIFWQSPFNLDNCPYMKIHRSMCPSIDHEWYDHFDIEESCECMYDVEGEHVEFHDCCCEACRCECCLRVCNCVCRCDLKPELDKWVESYSEQLKSLQFTKKTNYFCGSKYFAAPKATTAVFMSDNKSLLKNVPENCWRTDAQNTKIVIGLAEIKNETEKSHKSWDIDLGSFQFTIEETKVEIL